MQINLIWGVFMKIKPEYILKDARDGKIIVNSVSGDKVGNLVLDDTAAFLWEELEKGVSSKELLLHSLLEKFDISAVLALSNIDIFLKTMIQNGLIEL